MKRAALALALVACAHAPAKPAAPAQKVEFTQPEVVTASGDPEMRAAVEAYNAGRRAEAAVMLQHIAESSAGRRKAEALVQLGVIRIEDGARGEGAQLERDALAIIDAATDERVDPAIAAEAEYWLGEGQRFDFASVKLDPSSMNEKALSDALESKAQYLLNAQTHYLKCVRRGDAEWATAAGYRIGALYEDMHAALVDAPHPPNLTAQQLRVYDEELRKKVRNLLEKAIRAYDETLDVAERTGAKTEYVDKARESLERLRAALVGVGEN